MSSFRVNLRVGQEPFDLMDRQGFIKLSPIARELAGMKTDPSADPGERVFLPDQFIGFPELSLPGQDHEPFNVVPGRTRFVAGGSPRNVSRPQVSPAPGLVPIHRPQGDGDGRNVMEVFKGNLLLHRTLGAQIEASELIY